MPLPRAALLAIAAALLAAPLASTATAGHGTIAALDPDKDGSLDKGEVLRGAKAKFKRLNTDGDRTLEMDELHGVMSAAAFAAANPDNDGSLSLGEYLRFTKRVFKKANTDTDRTIEADELHHGHGRLLNRLIH
jgi:hypothetical protein